MANLYQIEGTFVPDKLFLGNEIPVITKGGALKAQQGLLKRGSVIVKDETGEGVLCTKINMEKGILGILTDDVTTATEGATPSISTVYQTGYFNEAALILGTDTTLKDIELELRKLGIYTGTVKEVE